MNISSLIEWWFLMPCLALCAAILTLIPMGVQVLTRGVVFIDLAVAQAAAAAAIWSTLWLHHPDSLSTQFIAVLGALLCSFIVAIIAKKWPGQREALIGLMYVLGACLALLGARLDPHGRDRLLALLASDILWAGWEQVAILSVCAIVVSILYFKYSDLLKKDLCFYPVFAIVASLAVQVLGLFLVFAILIAPALWVKSGWKIHGVIVLTILVSGVGLWSSWMFDLPSGVCVALSMTTWGMLSMFRTQVFKE